MNNSAQIVHKIAYRTCRSPPSSSDEEGTSLPYYSNHQRVQLRAAKKRWFLEVLQKRLSSNLSCLLTSHPNLPSLITFWLTKRIAGIFFAPQWQKCQCRTFVDPTPPTAPVFLTVYTWLNSAGFTSQSWWSSFSDASRSLPEEMFMNVAGLYIAHRFEVVRFMRTFRYASLRESQRLKKGWKMW